MHPKFNDMCLLTNVCLTFLFIIYTLLLYAELALAHTIAIPAKEVEEALFVGAQTDNNSFQDGIQKRGSSNGVRFGSSFGRKKRSLTLDDEIMETLESKFNHKSSTPDDAISVSQLIKNYPWLVVSILGDGKQSEYLSKRQSMKPRLGRSNTWLDDDEKMIKAPPFSPRLGRRSLIPLKPRLGRAGNNPETAVFKPRLGRDPNFNEFSEYITDGRNNIDGKYHTTYVYRYTIIIIIILHILYSNG